jgi:hypothetical protein
VTLKTGVIRNSQSRGLKAVSPWNSSREIDEVLVEEELIAASQNVGAVGIGGARLDRRGNQGAPRREVSLMADRFMKVCCRGWGNRP